MMLQSAERLVLRGVEKRYGRHGLDLFQKYRLKKKTIAIAKN